MNTERFQRLAETYGGDMSRWPKDTQAPARQLLHERPEVDVFLREAQTLDALLNTLPSPVMPEDLSAQILAALPTPTAQNSSRWLFPVWAQAAAFALCMLSGIYLGMQQAEIEQEAKAQSEEIFFGSSLGFIGES